MFKNFCSKFQNNIFRIFCPNIFRNCTMEAEDELYCSNQKLKQMINLSKNKDLAVLEYLKIVKYPPIGDFKSGLEWFNVSEPLSFTKQLKGKIVLLDFFTYCCINCMHILPDLKDLEREFTVEDGLVVVGVHSAKFANEKLSENILSAVQRYNITHPVVNDHESDMWRKCEVHCWPTLVLLGPKANPIVMLMGEGHKDDLHLYIRNLLTFYKERKEISSHSIPYKSAFHLLPDLKGPLLFPGKIAGFHDDNNELIAISDTGNSRILITNNEGKLIKQIGGNKVGFKDGTLNTAEFNNPQGLVFQNKDIIFVADTENHAIRKVDLKNNSVTTIAGTGEQGEDRVGGNQGPFQPLSSPWDVCLYRTSDLNKPLNDKYVKDVLIIAAAGTHQIWALFLDDIIWWKSKSYKRGTCLCIAGSGREENRNNTYPHAASFAQPSGLAISQKRKEVYIADSESSSIRRLSLVDGNVTPVVGGDRNPNNLFAFGDKDGKLYEAKLQHVLGVALSEDENTLFVADTYNHKLKKVDLENNSIETLCGKRTTQVDDDVTTFNEPGGLCIIRNKLYIADTNNHTVKVLQLDNNSFSSLLKFNLKYDSVDSTEMETFSKLDKLTLNALKVNSKGGKIILKLKLSFEEGMALADQAPQKWYVKLPNPTWSCVPNYGSNVEDIELFLSISESHLPKGVVNLVYQIVTCTSSTCTPKNFVISQGITFVDNGFFSVTNHINVQVTSKEIKLL